MRENRACYRPRFQGPGAYKGRIAPMPVSELRFYCNAFGFLGQRSQNLDTPQAQNVTKRGEKYRLSQGVPRAGPDRRRDRARLPARQDTLSTRCTSLGAQGTHRRGAAARARRGAGDQSSVMKSSRTLRICPTVMPQRLPATLRLHLELFQKSANALLDLVSDESYCMQRLAGGVG